MAAEVRSSEGTSEVNFMSAYELGAIDGVAQLQQDTDAVSSANFNSNAKKDTITSSLSRIESANTLGGGSKLDAEKRRGSSGKFSGENAERRYKLWLRAEIVGLCVLIVIVWGLLSLPIAFYYIPVVSDLTLVSVNLQHSHMHHSTACI